MCIRDSLDTMQLHGFGGTDFRPVFQYVDELVRAGEFTNLKGMICLLYTSRCV